MFVLYISALCNDDDQGKKLIHAVTNTLLTTPPPINSESNVVVQSETAKSGSTGPSDPGEGKPTLLWSVLYSQELTLGQVDFICSTPMTDGKLNYDYLIDATVKLFKEIFPEDEFFPRASSENHEDDGDGET
ncbi:rab escort protein 1-like [Hibiscus syriacus]|uniref:rab escort protein 1-like n=1 Tax=Hibiscus syriacus TaxID=106335 RepID=UPI001920AA1E|nr:rab escort protein 1-like [Hibiscus syriacus]